MGRGSPRGRGTVLWESVASRLRAEGKLEGKAEGKAGGEVTGRADLLVQLLAARFGIVPKPVRARIAAASSEQLSRWAIRCIDSESLAQVFADDGTPGASARGRW